MQFLIRILSSLSSILSNLKIQDVSWVIKVVSPTEFLSNRLSVLPSVHTFVCLSVRSIRPVIIPISHSSEWEILSLKFYLYLLYDGGAVVFFIIMFLLLLFSGICLFTHVFLLYFRKYFMCLYMLFSYPVSKVINLPRRSSEGLMLISSCRWRHL